MNKIKLIAGLGNPGLEYSNTRHNIGKDFLDIISNKFKFIFNFEKKFFAEYAKVNIFQEKVLFVKPLTYINDSGKSILAISNFFKIAPEEILIVHDELDISCGNIKIKFSGSSGGHNGINNIQKILGTADFWRLRIGIGHPIDKSKVISYVLNKPKEADLILINNAMKKGILVLDKIISGNFEASARVLHTK